MPEHLYIYICIFSLHFLFLLLFFPLLLLIATFVPRWFGKLIFYHLDPTLAWDPSSTWLYLSKSTFLQEPRVGRTQPPITSTVLIQYHRLILTFLFLHLYVLILLLLLFPLILKYLILGINSMSTYFLFISYIYIYIYISQQDICA